MAIRKIFLNLFVTAMLAISSGCVYQQAISQGNFLDQEDLDQVEVGMTKSQIRFLLGTPMIDDPFHANRWDYVYYLKLGRDDATNKRWVSIYFDDDVVSKIEQDQTLSPDL